MAKRRQRSFRIASPAIYRASKAAESMRPDMRAALAGEAFEMSTPDTMRLPSAAKRAELSGGARFPTKAKYWGQYSERRLMSATPLKGESRQRAKQRASKAKSFFAREREVSRRRSTKTQYRVALVGRVEQTSNEGEVTPYEGTQYGPWRDVPPGGLTDERIIAAYREVARYSVAIDARGRPEFGQQHSGGDFATYRAKGNSKEAILYVSEAEIQTREVSLDTPDEA